MARELNFVEHFQKIVGNTSAAKREKGRKGIDTLSRQGEAFLNNEFNISIDEGPMHLEVVVKVD